MGFAYVRIFKAAGQHNRRVILSSTNIATAALSNQTQIAITVFIMLIVFILCWTPYFVYVIYITANHRQDAISRDLALAAYWCVFMNSSLNPYIYGIRNPAVRAEFKKVMTLLMATLSDWFRLVNNDGSVTSFSVAQDHSVVIINNNHISVAKAASLLRTDPEQRNSNHSNNKFENEGCMNEDDIAEVPSLLRLNVDPLFNHYRENRYNHCNEKCSDSHVDEIPSRTDDHQTASSHSYAICNVNVTKASSLLGANGGQRHCCYSNECYNDDERIHTDDTRDRG